jgi:hypothetical protein
MFSATVRCDGVLGPIVDPVQRHGARIGSVDPAQDLEEGALAGSVLADERQGLSGTERQAHPPQRLRGTEGFGDSVEFESWRHGRQHDSPVPAAGKSIDRRAPGKSSRPN